jgi:hypothetical protein
MPLSQARDEYRANRERFHRLNDKMLRENETLYRTRMRRLTAEFIVVIVLSAVLFVIAYITG